MRVAVRVDSSRCRVLLRDRDALLVVVVVVDDDGAMLLLSDAVLDAVIVNDNNNDDDDAELDADDPIDNDAVCDAMFDAVAVADVDVDGWIVLDAATLPVLDGDAPSESDDVADAALDLDVLLEFDVLAGRLLDDDVVNDSLGLIVVDGDAPVESDAVWDGALVAVTDLVLLVDGDVLVVGGGVTVVEDDGVLDCVLVLEGDDDGVPDDDALLLLLIDSLLLLLLDAVLDGDGDRQAKRITRLNTVSATRSSMKGDDDASYFTPRGWLRTVAEAAAGTAHVVKSGLPSTPSALAPFANDSALKKYNTLHRVQTPPNHALCIPIIQHNQPSKPHPHTKTNHQRIAKIKRRRTCC